MTERPEGRMTDEHTAPWSTAWRWTKQVGPWVLIVVMGIYLVRTTYPSVDLSTPAQPLPDFTAPTLRGMPFQLSAHRGQVLVLNVWATWCPPCRLEVPGLNRLQHRFQDEDVQVVGLNVDAEGMDAVRAFVNERTITYPQVEARAIVRRHFPGEAIPRTYLVDRQGHVRFTHTGFLVPSALEGAIEALLDEPASDR
jgi:peroxiredoxin